MHKIHESEFFSNSTPAQGKPTALRWLDQMKGLALLWIILIHGVERIFKPPLFSNPNDNWATMADRIAQIVPLDGFGVANLPLNVLRYVGWLGDQGVQIFLMASGFGLAWSLLQRGVGQKFSWKQFYQRRLLRLYPMWWMAHLVFLVVLTIAGQTDRVSWRDPELYLSLLGFRVTQETFYYMSASWWFIGLLLQLYLIFPVLYLGLKRWGPLRLLVVTSLVALFCRGVGLLLLTDHIDIWSRGNVFVSRLPEFVVGISLAAWFYQKPEAIDRWLQSWKVQIAAIGIYLIGLIAAFSLPGMVVSPFLLGVGAFALFYRGLQQWGERASFLTWIGKHSYALFLAHHLWIKALVPFDQISWQAFARFGVACMISLVSAIGLEKSTNWLSERLTQVLKPKSA